MAEVSSLKLYFNIPPQYLDLRKTLTNFISVTTTLNTALCLLWARGTIRLLVQKYNALKYHKIQSSSF